MIRDNKTSGVLSFFGFFTLNQDEIGVKLTLGSFTGAVNPGLGFVIPIFQRVIKTKSSVQTIDLPDQKVVLNGNISVKISGSVNYRVTNPKRAILDVDNYEYSLRQLALTTISDVLGTKTIEQIRGNKKQIADDIEVLVSKTASAWGLSHVDIRLTDAEMDDSLLRAMMRETEAEKESNAILIKAEADKRVAQTFSDAAKTLGESPGAMTLRILQTLSDMSNSKSTVVMPIPIDFLSGLQGMGGTGHNNLQGPVGDVAPSLSPPPPPKKAKPYKASDGKVKADCPYCGARYKVDNVLGNNKFDVDPETPGIQLNCKKCHKTFTLES